MSQVEFLHCQSWMSSRYHKASGGTIYRAPKAATESQAEALGAARMATGARVGSVAGACVLSETADGCAAAGRISDFLCSIAAPMNAAKSGCGSSGFDSNSGWNWQPRNQGCSGASTIST